MILLFSGTSRIDSVIQLITVLIIFVFVLGLTYVVTRWIGRYQQGQLHNKNIHVVETFKVTNNKYIQIIKVAESYLVIAICKDSITMLTRLSEEEILHLKETPVEAVADFQEIFQKLKNSKLKKWTGNDEDENEKKKM